jgi:RND family efflux transporter MFP subunit
MITDLIGNTPKVHPPQVERGKGTSRTRRALLTVAAIVAIGGLVFRGVQTRADLDQVVRADTNQLAIPSVYITHPQPEPGSREVVLPASVQAFTNAPIFARITGYLKSWNVDIGGHVQKGQLLAVVEAPEVDQQVEQARGNLATATANLQVSQITAQRYSEQFKNNAVSQQARDTAVGTFQANKATVAANQGNLNALEAQQSFEKIYAPFDGIVTARNTDIGQLIDAGANGGAATELFNVAAIDVLRVYVNVPQIYSNQIRLGMSVNVTLPQFPNRRFVGKLVRTAQAIDPASRTLLVEVDVSNPHGLLLPGAYAEAHFKLAVAARHALVVPDTALIFRTNGLQVGTVTDGKAMLKDVQAGQDFGTTIEVLSGLNPKDAVIANPPDSLVSGEAVRPVLAGSSEAQHE